VQHHRLLHVPVSTDDWFRKDYIRHKFGEGKINVAAIEAYTEEDNLNESSSGEVEIDEGTQNLGLRWWKEIVGPELKNILGQQVSLYFIVTFSSNSLLY
jgi:hypothetical protein